MDNVIKVRKRYFENQREFYVLDRNNKESDIIGDLNGILRSRLLPIRGVLKLAIKQNAVIIEKVDEIDWGILEIMVMKTIAFTLKEYCPSEKEIGEFLEYAKQVILKEKK